MENLTQQIPGLAEAIEAEQHVRDTSFLELPECVGGFDLKPLTLRHILLLNSIGNKFVTGGHPTSIDIGVFMCVAGEWTGAKKFFMLRRLGRKNPEKISNEIVELLKETFQDAPATSGTSASVSYYSFAAQIVDLFGKEYGWTDGQTLSVPLKRLFQYIKPIAVRNSNATLFNPSDKVRGEWLRAVNSSN